MNEYKEVQSYLSHSKKKSSAGMPTNLKQESSNIKRASERAKFMNEMKQICDKIRVNDEQLTNLQKANFDTYNDPVRGNGRKTGGGYTGAEEINKLRWKYSKENNPLVKRLHNLLNSGKNSPLFTDAEKEKMKRWMQEGGTLDELATIYNDIFGSVAHSGLEEDNMSNEYTEINAYLQHGLFDIFKSKPKYTSTGSKAGMPSNIHLGDSTNPSSKASAIQDELIRMNKKLVEYKSAQEKAKAEYDQYRKLAKDTENRIRDLERSRDAAIKESVNYTGRPTTVTSSAPDKTKLVRTNPIFDRDVANLRKRR